jgi:hypothetical protein
MKVWVVKEWENYGDATECLVRVYSTEDKAKEDLIKIYNDFLYNVDDSEEEEFIKQEWENNGWVADENTVWALMSDMIIDDGISF